MFGFFHLSMFFLKWIFSQQVGRMGSRSIGVEGSRVAESF